jgi:hypothetical protein
MQRGLANVDQEFPTFLATSAKPGRDTWQTCTDVDVLVFLQRHYSPYQEGHDGGSVAPSTLQKAVALLSRLFIREKRSGPWTAVHGTTTTLHCPLVILQAVAHRTPELLAYVHPAYGQPSRLWVVGSEDGATPLLSTAGV